MANVAYFVLEGFKGRGRGGRGNPGGYQGRGHRGGNYNGRGRRHFDWHGLEC